MIKNYTSSVPPLVTISRIEESLMRAGASGIQKDFENGRIAAVTFRVSLPQGKDLAIRLPASSEAVFQSLRAKRKRRVTQAGETTLRDQAERTAWKLIQDWVEIQLSLIAMQQAEFLQVFLPYVWDGRRTYFETLKRDEFLALPEPKDV